MNCLKLAPLNHHICNHSLHTGTSIYFDVDQGIDWINIKKAVLGVTDLQMLKAVSFTGTANFILTQHLDLRVAPIKSGRLKDCGLEINGHEHLSKNEKNEQESVCGAGQVYFIHGEIISINNQAPAFCPPGLSETTGPEYMQQLQKGFEKAINGSIKGIEYESYDYLSREIQKIRFP